MPLDPKALAANAEVVDRLGWTFDLRIETDPEEEPLWFSLDGVEAISRFARDSTGGVFALLAGTSRVLYVTSKGAAGIVAADLDAFIGLVTACPYWQNLLKFSGNGKLDEMRRAAAALEAGTVDDPELDEARALLNSELRLAEPADPVRSLHRAVSTSDVIVRGLDGNPFGSLFNSLIVDENLTRRLFGG